MTCFFWLANIINSFADYYNRKFQNDCDTHLTVFLPHTAHCNKVIAITVIRTITSYKHIIIIWFYPVMLPNLLMDITDSNAQFFMICNNKKSFQNPICFLNRRNFLKEIRAKTALIDISLLPQFKNNESA